MQFSQKISPCLWFDSPEGSVMTVIFEIEGLPFTALNGGPVFRFVVPRKMVEWFTMADDRSQRAFAAMMEMGKLDIAALERAYHG